MRGALRWAMGAFLLAWLPGVGVSAQQPAVSEEVVARIRSEVARRWDMDAEALVLEFGPLPAEGPREGHPDVEVLGSGSGGHWLVRLTSTGGSAASFRVRAGVTSTVFVASGPLERGQVLAETDVATAEEIRWGPPASPDPRPQAGWVVQRVIRDGEALRSPAVQAPLAVHSGRPVDLVWKRGGIGIRMRGRAAGSARVGDEVFVRTEGGERLKGVVLAPGVVDVTRGGLER